MRLVIEFYEHKGVGNFAGGVQVAVPATGGAPSGDGNTLTARLDHRLKFFSTGTSLIICDPTIMIVVFKRESVTGAGDMVDGWMYGSGLRDSSLISNYWAVAGAFGNKASPDLKDEL